MLDCYLTQCCPIRGGACEECRTNGRLLIIDRLFIKNSRIPKAYLPSDTDPSKILADSGSFELLSYAKQFGSGPSKSLYLYSKSPGTGKTTLACNLLLKALYMNCSEYAKSEKECPVLYLNVVELLDALRSSMNTPDEGLDELKRLLTSEDSPDYLVLDDIGAERPSDWVRERLYAIINYRVSNKLTTIYTSNCSPEEIGSILGPRIYSRISGNTLCVTLRGRDHRLTEK